MKHNNKKSMLRWAILGLIGILSYVFLFKKVFPPAPLDVRIDKNSAIKVSLNYLKSYGYQLNDYKIAVTFNENRLASYFLQRINKLYEARELIAEDFPLWYWWIRYFKPLEKEEFRVALNPENGRIIYFEHLIPEEQEAPLIAKEKAEEIARNYLLSYGINPLDYQLLDYQQYQQPNRKDHKFSWGIILKEYQNAKFYYHVGIQGNELGTYSVEIKVPEQFKRSFRRYNSQAKLLQLIGYILTFFLFIICFIFALRLSTRTKLAWKNSLLIATFLSLIFIINYINQIPLIWINYDTSISTTVYLATIITGFAISIAVTLLVLVLFLSLSAGLSDNYWEQAKQHFISKLSYLKSYNLAKDAFIGYCLGSLILGIVFGFYYIAKLYFKIWIPLTPYFSNAISSPLPFITAIAISLEAGVSEELIFRMFAISLFRKIFKIIPLAIIFSAIIWGLGHATIYVYPVYFRVIEVTLIGVILGIIFLKYGLETVIFAHIYYNLIIIATALIISGVKYAQLSGILAITFLLLPFLNFIFLTSRGKRNSFFKLSLLKPHLSSRG